MFAGIWMNNERLIPENDSVATIEREVAPRPLQQNQQSILKLHNHHQVNEEPK